MKIPNWTSLAAIAIAVSSIAFALIVQSAAPEDAGTFGTIPDFALTERSGRTVTRSELDGQIWVADFIFTNCGGTCPVMTYQMEKLQDLLPESVRLVSFTVDPTRDTAEVLAAYAAAHGAEGDRWLFLTGDREELYRLAQEGFHLAVDDSIGTEIEPITHSSRFALIDAQGRIRNYYDGTSTEAISRIVADVETLLD